MLRNRTTRILIAGLTALTLAGVGCTSAGDEPADPASTSVEDTQVPEASEAADSPESPEAEADEPSDGETEAVPSEVVDLINAGLHAADEVDDSTVVGVESEDDDSRWEVELQVSDGTIFEVEMSRDGLSVLQDPVEKNDSPESKEKHRTRLEADQIGFQVAASTAVGEVPGVISELGLDTEDGVVVWEADVHDENGTKHEIKIDSETGEVVLSEVDD